MRKTSDFSASSPALLNAGASSSTRRPASAAQLQLKALAWQAAPFDVDAENRRIKDLTASYAPAAGGRRKVASAAATSSSAASTGQAGFGGLAGMLNGSPGGLGLSKGLKPSQIVARLEAAAAQDEGAESPLVPQPAFTTALDRLKRRNLDPTKTDEVAATDERLKQRWMFKLKQEQRVGTGRLRRGSGRVGVSSATG
mmetsp:Transcript_32821/g.60045  ORF Transcript_32821/g.60045 Transcript_32821/m.60045 type:complete len:198 (+) Transcript_32821:117-710(+)